MRIKGRTAIVTGASSGIGRSTALLLARRGATVVAGGRNGERLSEVAAASERIVPVVGDVRSAASLSVAPEINTDDLIEAVGVTALLGLAQRTSVSVYQRRYPDMPRPVMDLGPGRPLLWSRSALISWATARGRLQRVNTHVFKRRPYRLKRTRGVLHDPPRQRSMAT